MAANSLFYLFSLLFLLLLTKTSASLPPAAPPNSNSAAQNSTEFILTSCQQTLYPDLCVASLARYALPVNHNPVRLARIAARLTFFQIHSAAAHVSAYLHRGGAPSTGLETEALRDCVDSLGSAAQQTRRSAAEIGKLDGGAVGTEVAWRVSNAQTWMSAALTNEETCTDGFGELGQDRVKVDVFGRVGRVKEYTSNALALVSCLVNGR